MSHEEDALSRGGYWKNFPLVEKRCPDHDDHRTFFVSCRAHLFIDVSSPARERVLKDQLEMALVLQFNRGRGTGLHRREVTKFSCDSVFFSASTGSKNPFSSLFIVADCGCDMTGLKHDTSQPPQSATKQANYSNMENEVQYKLHIFTRTINGQLRNCSQCAPNTPAAFVFFLFFFCLIISDQQYIP